MPPWQPWRLRLTLLRALAADVVGCARIADRLAQLLREDQVLPDLPSADLEELTIYLARNARNVERVLKGKEPEPTPPSAERTDHSEAPAEQSSGDADSKVTELKRASSA